jgi:hypothetical protein
MVCSIAKWKKPVQVSNECRATVYSRYARRTLRFAQEPTGPTVADAGNDKVGVRYFKIRLAGHIKAFTKR